MLGGWTVNSQWRSQVYLYCPGEVNIDQQTKRTIKDHLRYCMCAKLWREVDVYGNYASYDNFVTKRFRVRAFYNVKFEVYFKVVGVDHHKRIIKVQIDHIVDPLEWLMAGNLNPRRDGWCFSRDVDGQPFEF